MLPEPVRAAAARARELWDELDGLYAHIEARLAAGDWTSIDDDARRLDVLGGELTPLVRVLAAAGGEAPADSAAARAWETSAERGRALAARRRDVERRVREAIDLTTAELARVRAGRGQARRYRAAPAVAPRFTSRRA